MTEAAVTHRSPPARAGRPRQDAYQRREEIFAAIAPLLLQDGARSLTMRRLARAAHLSVGAIYHYFSSKMDLLTFPLQDEACAEMMRRFDEAHSHLLETDPEAYMAAFIDQMVAAFPMLRASFAAAVEMGAEGLWEVLDAGIGGELEEVLAALAKVRDPEFDARERARSLKRTYLGAVLDRSIHPDELSADLHRVLADATARPA